MAKAKEAGRPSSKSTSITFSTSETSIDPALASLFASSSGPVKVPSKPAQLSQAKLSGTKDSATENEVGDESSSLRLESGAPAEVATADQRNIDERPRKRRRVQEDDLEATYFTRLAREEKREQGQQQEVGEDADETSSSRSSSADETDEIPSEDEDSLPHHISLNADSKDDTAEKAKRTVFLSNVSINAIKSKTSKKTLVNHLESVLGPTADKKDSAKVESIRFRSTAYASGVGPKKAAFAKKELMDQTMRSTNAYVVFTAEWAARKVASRLNGSIVLDRHLRADHLAYPSKIDHKCCVFVGNLSFVDQAMTEETTENGETKVRRPKAREPADAEEGLWRTFGKVGKVESVRVVRDKETRISKGFAYVQFADQNGVEAALLLNEKKFPPMLPRKLRVMRAKRSKERSTVSPKSRATGGFANGHAVSRKVGSLRTAGSRGGNISGKAERFVFEGHRASKVSGNKEKKHKKKQDVRSATRSALRGAAFKAAGGKRRRDHK